jgi:aryl-alcohol dehydrogenase-like predicted oxidoreductase
MEFTHLSRRGLQVSRLCLGTMSFGWPFAGDELIRAAVAGAPLPFHCQST